MSNKSNLVRAFDLILIFVIWTLIHTADGYVAHSSLLIDHTFPQLVVQHVRRAGPDPGDFSWVNRWAAIGDSFTAGIGSGNLFSKRDEDWKCSRYDHSYPAIVNNALGPTVTDFQYVACSGDRSVQIFDQVDGLNDGLDLVMLTAGGNDLCLAGIIKTCIFLPFQGEAKCQSFLDKAQENIDTILKPNLKQILIALNDKMNKNSVVVFNQYAQYFNTETDGCTNDEEWAFPKFWFQPLKLTKDRRTKFNTLVVNINNAIGEVVDDVTKTGNVKFKVLASDWDPWPIEGVSGQYCAPESSGKYPDEKQPDLQFFKPDTNIEKGWHDELKRRDNPVAADQKRGMIERSTEIYDSLLYKSENPPAGALHKLNPRAPTTPGCPGDGKIDWATLGMGLPDSFGKYFHPNEKGHETIAAFALETMIEARAEVLGVSDPVCQWSSDFTCWRKDGRKAYATADPMNKNIKKFCDQVKAPQNTVGWKSEVTYFEGTPDEHTFTLQLTNKASKYDHGDCMDAFNRIVTGCDANDPDNPMNWKFGGRYAQDEYTYEINVKRDNRPWPPIKKPYGDCEGWYKVFFSSYKLKGGGWASWDKGEETIKPSMKGCLGLGITAWSFKYYDAPDKDGNEWEVSFHTPIWVRARCFKNNKVALASGGFTDGCRGND